MLDVDEFEQFRARAYSAGGGYGDDSQRRPKILSVPSSPKPRKPDSFRASFRSARGVPYTGTSSAAHTPHTPSPLTNNSNFRISDLEQQVYNISLDHDDGMSPSVCDSDYDAELESLSRSPTKALRDDFGPSDEEIDNEVFRPRTPLGWRSLTSSPHDPYRALTPPPSSTMLRVGGMRTHHKRSSSCRAGTSSRPVRPHDLDLWHGRPRQRTYSMPTRNRYRKMREAAQAARAAGADINDSHQDQADDSYYRVRTFSTSGKKGIINRGDSFKRRYKKRVVAEFEAGHFRQRTWSCTSQGSSVGSAGSGGEAGTYKVLMLGSSGVGKTSLVQQFMSSEYMGNADASLEEEEEENTVIPVLLDEQESLLEILETTSTEDLSRDMRGDAYVVAYSLTDRSSFDEAVEMLYDLRKDDTLKGSAFILVANKGDLVRNRELTSEEGKVMAVHYGCKYIEVSAVLNHKVDELLVGIVKQIRLHSRTRSRRGFAKCLGTGRDTGCMRQAARGIVGRLLKKHSIVFRSCDNLLVL